MNQASHYVDLLDWLVGPVESMQAMTSTTRKIETEDTAVLNVKWRNGALGSMTVTMLSSHRIINPHGAKGGEAGAIGENSVIRANGEHQPLKGNDEISVLSGDVVVLKSPGGGGFKNGNKNLSIK